MVILLVQTVVGEMQEFVAEHEDVVDPENNVENEDVENLVEEEEELDPAQRKKIVNDRIQDQQVNFQNRLKKLTKRAYGVPDIISLDPDIMTEEEKTLKENVDQLQKSLDILACLTPVETPVVDILSDDEDVPIRRPLSKKQTNRCAIGYSISLFEPIFK